jgi:hypothetical protein
LRCVGERDYGEVRAVEKEEGGLREKREERKMKGKERRGNEMKES